MNEIDDNELINLIKAGSEKPDLDYKVDIDLTASKKEKVEITKDVIAMANYGGGVIVGGVSEDNNGFKLQGMPATSLKPFDSTALNDFVSNYCDPPINSTTKKITINTNIYGIILVPGFTSQPHIVTKSYPNVLREGDILIRSNSNNSLRANPHSLRRMIDKAVKYRQGRFKELLQTAIESSSPALVGGVDETNPESIAPFDLDQYKDEYTGFRITRILPEETFQISPVSLRETAIESQVNSEFDRYTFPPLNFINNIEERFPFGIAIDEGEEYNNIFTFLFLGTNGEIYCVENMWEDQAREPNEDGEIGLFTTLQRIFGSLLFAKRYYSKLGFDGLFYMIFTQESSIPRKIISEVNPNFSLLMDKRNNMDTPVSVDISLDADEDFVGLKNAWKEMAQVFFWFFHYDIDEEKADKFFDTLGERYIDLDHISKELS